MKEPLLEVWLIILANRLRKWREILLAVELAFGLCHVLGKFVEKP